MTLWRTTAGINKAEDSGRMDAQIRFADALRWVLLTTVASTISIVAVDLPGAWSDRSSGTFDLR